MSCLLKMRGRRTSNVRFRTDHGARTVSCVCPDCRGNGRTASRASELRETAIEISDQLADDDN